MIIVLLIALFMKDQFIVNYLNASFMVSLFFLAFAGIAYTVIYGFWDVFAKGAKFLFSRRDDEGDWSTLDYEEKFNNKSEGDLLRANAKKELFLFLPLTIGLLLLIISIIILLFV